MMNINIPVYKRHQPPLKTFILNNTIRSPLYMNNFTLTKYCKQYERKEYNNDLSRTELTS